MSIVYKLSWTDNSYYYGKSIHNNIEGRYGSTLEYYLKNASNDDVRAKLNEFGLPSVEIIDQTEDWDQTDDLEEFLIRVYINNNKCLNKSLIFIPIKLYIEQGYEEELVLKVANDIKNTDLTCREIGAKHGITGDLVSQWNSGQTKKGLLESHGYSVPIRKPNINEDNIVLECADLIKNTDMTLKEIGAKYNLKKELISNWNTGACRKGLLESHGYTFPIRKGPIYNEEELVLKVANDIKNTNLTLKEIALKYNLDEWLVNNWNHGAHRKLLESHGYTFPIRKNPNQIITDEVVLECADLIKNTDLTYREIALKYNIGERQVGNWNHGTRRKGLLESHGYTFPIRSKNSAIKTESVDSLKINA